MVEMKCHLKISYQGKLSQIECEADSSYEEVIAQAASCFGIDESQQYALVLTNGQAGSYVFEPQLFEYFLLLFPSPEIVFHLRLDWQQLRRGNRGGSSRCHNNKRKRHVKEEQDQQPLPDKEEEEEDSYEAVPVYRQNCFVGSLPSSNKSAALVQRQNCFLQEQPQNEPESSLQEEPEQMPQSKRIRLRRSAANVLSQPTQRSIRI